MFILRAADLRGCDFYEGCCGNEPRDVFNPLLNGKTVKPFGREGKRLLTSPQTTGRMTDRFYSHICGKKKKVRFFPLYLFHVMEKKHMIRDAADPNKPEKTHRF